MSFRLRCPVSSIHLRVEVKAVIVAVKNSFALSVTNMEINTVKKILLEANTKNVEVRFHAKTFR